MPQEEEKPAFTQPAAKPARPEVEKVRYQEPVDDDDDEGIPSFFSRR